MAPPRPGRKTNGGRRFFERRPVFLTAAPMSFDDRESPTQTTQEVSDDDPENGFAARGVAA
jgi:hypothetical protein